MSASGSQSRIKYRIRKGLFFFILLTPLWSYCWWLASSSRPFKVAMLNKTTQEYNDLEHRAFTWVLNHHRWTKANGQHYNSRRDFLGPIPQLTKLSKTTEIQQLSKEQIDSIADILDAGYFIDTYGTYYEDLDERDSTMPSTGLIYGGLERSDVSLMQALVERNKLVLAEFSIFGYPTPPDIKERAENILGARFTGWVGRYWEELDTSISGEIPDWIPYLYEEKYNKPYAFSGPGIGFFHDNGDLLIIPERELIHKVPIMETEKELAATLGVDPFVRYPFWFEICEPDTAVRSLSQFRIYPGAEAQAKMRSLQIPTFFPAVLVHKDWKTIYFAGDFTDNTVGMTSSHFAGITNFGRFFYDNRNMGDRRKFFWEWYEPFVSGTIERYMNPDLSLNDIVIPPSAFEVHLNTHIDRSAPKVNWSSLECRIFPNCSMDSSSTHGIEGDSIAILPTDTGDWVMLSDGVELPTPEGQVQIAQFYTRSQAEYFVAREGVPSVGIQYELGTGAYNVIIPCNTYEDAQAIVAACKVRYPKAISQRLR